jgi:hypothetical protein
MGASASRHSAKLSARARRCGGCSERSGYYHRQNCAGSLALVRNSCRASTTASSRAAKRPPPRISGRFDRETRSVACRGTRSGPPCRDHLGRWRRGTVTARSRRSLRMRSAQRRRLCCLVAAQRRIPAQQHRSAQGDCAADEQPSNELSSAAGRAARTRWRSGPLAFVLARPRRPPGWSELGRWSRVA